MPLLYNSLGAVGPFLCALFFICLALAGLSSLISIMELAVHTLQDMEGKNELGIGFESRPQIIQGFFA